MPAEVEFAALVERYQRLVVGVALAITRDRALAEDIGQETFVSAWRSLGSLQNVERVGPWLAGIARNLANNAMRKHARRTSLEPTSDRDLTQTPFDQLAARERDALLRLTLDELPTAQRETLVLYYFEERSVDHVASGLGVSHDVVKQRLHRAREAVRARLTERLESTLESMRPSAAFTGLVVSAIALGAVTKASAAATSMATTKGMVMLKAALVVGSALTIGTLVVVRLEVGTPTPAQPTTTIARREAAPARPQPLPRIEDVAASAPAIAPPPRLPEAPAVKPPELVKNEVKTEPTVEPGQLRGHVGSDGTNIAGATVSVSPGSARAETGADGMFQLDLAPGVYKVNVSKSGLKEQTLDVTVDPNGVTIKTIQLQP